MALVYIPALLRDLTAGCDCHNVSGDTVADLIAQLDALYPGFRGRLCDGDRLKPGLAISVDGQLASLGLMQPIAKASEVHFLPAIGGGGHNNDH